jgi:hypothetical protein
MYLTFVYCERKLVNVHFIYYRGVAFVTILIVSFIISTVESPCEPYFCTIYFHIVTCTPIARQRVGKQVPTKTDFW